MYFSTYTTHTFFMASFFVTRKNNVAHLRHIMPFVFAVKARIQAIRSPFCAHVFATAFDTRSHIYHHRFINNSYNKALQRINR